MREPSVLFYAVLIICCLLLAAAGLFVLVNFGRLFRGRIRSELLRKNVVTLLAIFFLSSAFTPMGGGFFLMIGRFGWVYTILIQIGIALLYTLTVYNLCRVVAEHPRLKRLSFLKHKLLIMLILIVSAMVVNLGLSYLIYHDHKEYHRYLQYGVITNLYLSATIGLVYAVISYLDIERKRKFDEKELELSQLRELKAKAELDALHSKVNPHFLYNALNSIADLSITDGKKARQMTIALADLFRYSINYSNNNYSTVKDEVEMANVYLQIEKIRFEDKLNYSLKVEEGLDHYLVPRFVLQPLVENAVKHGLKATGQITQINLEVKRSEKGLVMNIADTGPLFPAELSPGYGVKSVYDKLDLLFPGNYEMHFSNEPVKQVSLYIHKLVKDESAI
ncbi:MAG TPA: histidine kinase [Chitinophagaceae bacterium]|jgi:sensor histidine kinase YesM|nr:histidine kinase [Chitinophagaceae bacterium]